MEEDNEEVKVVPDVDSAKSIRKQKLIYKKTFGYIILDYFMVRGIFILLTAGMLYASCQELLAEKNYAGIILSCLPLAWVIVNLFYLNTLVAIKGQGIVRNKEDVMNTLKHFYDDLTFDASAEDMIRDVKPTGWRGSGRVLSVLLDNDKVYFHKATLMRGSVIMPVWGLIDYLKAKEIAAYFAELQARPNT